MADILSEAENLKVSNVIMDVETPKKTEIPEQVTPRRSERKRALFPTASPQTSDLGHMSPLGSSPDRYSSAPNTPDSGHYLPVKAGTGPVSPFGRKIGVTKSLYNASPRKRFSELFGKTLQEQKTNGQITPISAKKVEKKSEIVPLDQLEQTMLSAMDDSDCAESPKPQRTPLAPSKSQDSNGESLGIHPLQPLTPSKRRSIPASGSGSTSSTSPRSPHQLRRHSLESRLKSAELPRARTSLFSADNCSTGGKRVRDDGIYLTGRGAKRGRKYGEINGGVRTGIRRPPKVKPKPKQSIKKPGKFNSIWDVAPNQTSKKMKTPSLKAPKMSLLAKPVKHSDDDIAAFSASGSLQVRSKRSRPVSESVELDEEEEEDPAPDPSKRFFRSKLKRAVTYTMHNCRMKFSTKNGQMSLVKSPPGPPMKRRRKLYNRNKQISDLQAFEDNHEDLAESTRDDVQNILKKLEEEKYESPKKSLQDPKSSLELGEPSAECTSIVNVDLKSCSAAPSSPPRSTSSPPGSENFLSPLSQLATSTSTLSINVGGATLHLNQAQIRALSEVPDVVMEDDDLLCEPLPEENVSNVFEVQAANEMKENEGSSGDLSDSTPVKYFPIFTANFSSMKTAPNFLVTERKRKRSLLRPIGNDQYQLDAGQKRFGHTECKECGAVYQMGEPDDEIAHQDFHNAVRELKHLGWKQEHIVGEYGKDRAIMIRPGDPKPWWSKASKTLQVIDKELGFAEGVHCNPDNSMVYLYVSDNTIVGFLLAIPIKKAFKMLIMGTDTGDIDCCSAEEHPVKCGISRIWVHESKRRCHIASRLVDCMRKNFIFGHVLSLDELAFSTPTEMGKSFAEKYVGRKDYFVFVQS